MQPEIKAQPETQTAPAATPVVMPLAPGESIVFASPGVPMMRKIGTGLLLALVAGFTLVVAIGQGANVVVSTIIGAVFILGFVGYLRIIAPQPFRVMLTATTLTYQEAAATPQEIPWSSVVKIKEERFPNGLPISLAVYKRVGERGLHRACLIWRDDLPELEGLIAALHAHILPTTRWTVETVHE